MLSRTIRKGATSASLSLSGVSKSYAAVAAVRDVSLEIPAGSTTAIIGPNGAGKTTLLQLIAGSEKPTAGTVTMDGRPIGGLGPVRASRAGVGFAHQVPQPFRALSVRDNVRVGAVQHKVEHVEAWVDHVLEFCGLAPHADRHARDLQILDLKRLELARAMSTKPTLLLLDEVCAGLNGHDLETVISLVDRLRSDGPTVILVEHIEAVVAQLASRVVVLDWGELIADGTPKQIAEDPKVREVYTGAGHSARVVHEADFGTAQPGHALRVRELRTGYGAIETVHGVSIEVRPGRISAILGANGAGKTSVANAISGVIPVRGGTIELDDARIDQLAPYRRAAAGLAVVPEGRRILTELTVRENLLLATPFTLPKPQLDARLDGVLETFTQLRDLMTRKGGRLSGGQQQMLAIGRALMSDPKYLICDEVSLGLAPVAIDALYDGLLKVVARGVGVAVIEQHVQRSLAIADFAYVIDRGLLSYAGSPAPLRDPDVLDKAYFGGLDAASLALHN